MFVKLVVLFGMDDFVIELYEVVEGFICSVGVVFECGLLLLIDYGFLVVEYYYVYCVNGMFMCYYW